MPAPDASPAAAADAPSILDGADIDDEDVNSVAANNGASSSSNGAGAPPPPAAAPGGPGSLHAGHGQLFSQAWKVRALQELQSLLSPFIRHLCKL